MVVLLAIFANAQGQLRNFGNFHALPGSTITFYGDVMVGGTFADDSQEITFNGPGTQVISGTATITFKNLTADNPSGVTLQQNVIVTSLSLDSGPLNLNGRTITISNSASTAISRTTGYIISENVSNTNKLIWNIGTDTNPHVFPFGTAGGNYIPFTLTNTVGNIGNVTVSTYPTATNNLPYPSAPTAVTNLNGSNGDNSANVVDRFWQIDKDGPAGTATITFTATPAEVGTITTLQAQRWNSASQIWDQPLAGQTNDATSVTVSGVTSFSPWAMSGNNKTLPIELLSFTATPIQTDVSVDWETSSEHNNAYFTILRSKDGKEFSEIASVPAGTAGGAVQTYNYFDTNAFHGRSYYRLKQTDLDGKHSFSDVRTVTIGDDAAFSITVFPNPTTNDEFLVDFQRSLESPTAVVVYNVVGAVIFNIVVAPGVKTFLVHLSDPPKGVYIARAVSDKFNLHQAIVVK